MSGSFLCTNNPQLIFFCPVSFFLPSLVCAIPAFFLSSRCFPLCHPHTPLAPLCIPLPQNAKDFCLLALCLRSCLALFLLCFYCFLSPAWPFNSQCLLFEFVSLVFLLFSFSGSLL